MALNAKQKGNRWELLCAHLLKPTWPQVATARLMSKAADDAGMDLVNTGRFNIQCKHVERGLDLHGTLDKMPTFGFNIVLWKRNRKTPLAVLTMSQAQELTSLLLIASKIEKGESIDASKLASYQTTIRTLF
jgi:hypothetical protein